MAEVACLDGGYADDLELFACQCANVGVSDCALMHNMES